MSLNDGRILSGDGYFNRQTWRPTTEHPRTYTVEMPIVRFGWNRYAFRFVPEKSGSVTLTLLGPWEEATAGSGNLFKKEVLWDDFKATGTFLTNPSFESVRGGGIIGWSGGLSQLGTEEVPAVDGSRIARTWHNGAMSINISVTAGIPVTLEFASRAVVPLGFREMQRVVSRDTAAHQARLRFMRGVNLGNYLEAPPNTWGTIVYSQTDFSLIRSEGFDHVRIPVGWHHYTGSAPNYTLANTIFDKANFLVTNALNAGLNVVLDLHLYDVFMDNPEGEKARFYAMWRQIAERYKQYGPALAFELLNEPSRKATPEVMNPIYAEAIGHIRAISPTRTLIIGTSGYNGIDDLNDLHLPDDDLNLMATVHSYEPFYFTHQGAEWTGTDTATTGLVFPGPPATPLQPHPLARKPHVLVWFDAYNRAPTYENPSSPLAFEARLRRVRQWADYFGRPVYVGEFGCYQKADDASRIRFHHAIRKALDAEGLPWAMWDWKAGFHYILNGQPHPPGMREAIFPPINLKSPSRGLLQFETAIGKRYRFERALNLSPPLEWEAIHTEQALTSPFEFLDPASTNVPAGFYRVHWIK